jgi:hypothetical protein
MDNATWLNGAPRSKPNFSTRSQPTRPQRKRGRRHVGFPLAFLIDVCRLTEGRVVLVLAICIYRRTHVCRSSTVALPLEELAELGVNRRRKNEALAKLQAAGLIRIESAGAGQSAKVTMLWQPS